MISGALHRLLLGFRARTRIHDPWLPPSLIEEAGAEPAPLDAVLGRSDTVFVLAAATDENRGLLGARAVARMRQGAALIVLSRADVVDPGALMAAVAQGRIRAASDVWREEPLPRDHPVRRLPGFLRSAQRAGALDVAFRRMGRMGLADRHLTDRGLPPLRGKHAESETAARMRSRPVSRNRGALRPRGAGPRSGSRSPAPSRSAGARDGG